MSDHKTLGKPSLWIPERDLRKLAAIGKLAEETAELNKIVARMVIQGIDGKDPETQRPNLEVLKEEIADVRALMAVVEKELALDPMASQERVSRKYHHKREWLDMISANQCRKYPV